MQQARVQSPVQEDPTCRRVTKPVHHNYQSPSFGACAPQREVTATKHLQLQLESSPQPPRLEEALAQQWRLGAAKNKHLNKKKKK